jgi:hypothetical protein
MIIFIDVFSFLGGVVRQVLFLALALLLVSVQSVGGEERPMILGYGVKSCDDYLAAYQGWEQGDEMAISEYLFYREWLAGMATGLSLATGTDVLKGVEIKGVMRRIQIICDLGEEKDFFNATMKLIKTMSRRK